MALTPYIFDGLKSYFPIWLGFILVSVVSVVVQTPWFKGLFGEFRVKRLIRSRLDRKQYRTFHNVMLETPDGTTQIDHIIISRFGLFVLETKNMKGWIFGNPQQPTWTQQIYKRKHKFQNPLRQNFKHAKALETTLGISEAYIHSVVVFVGNSSFRTPMPENVVEGRRFIEYIKAKTEPIFTDTQVQTFIRCLEKGKLENTRQAKRDHVERLKSRRDPNSAQRCPKCGSNMILRTAKKGSNVGRQFWGCSNFPRCRATRHVS